MGEAAPERFPGCQERLPEGGDAYRDPNGSELRRGRVGQEMIGIAFWDVKVRA